MREVHFVRSANNYDTDVVSVNTGITFVGEESMTQQHFKEECDINEIVRRFGITGQMPENVRVPMEGDFEEVFDFQSAMNAVRKAEEGFMELPAEVRYRFSNDPQRLMEFMADDRNREEAVKLGLVNKPPEVPREVEPSPVVVEKP